MVTPVSLQRVATRVLVRTQKVVLNLCVDSMQPLFRALCESACAISMAFRLFCSATLAVKELQNCLARSVELIGVSGTWERAQRG